MSGLVEGKSVIVTGAGRGIGEGIARDLAAEMELHLEMKTQEYIVRGMSAEQARRQARLDFGSVALAAERSREGWGFPLIENIFRDLRAVRTKGHKTIPFECGGVETRQRPDKSGRCF